MASMPEITEKVFTQQVKDLARTFGWRFYHPWLSMHSERGFPDCTLVKDRVVFAELKRESGTVSDKQAEWIEALRGAGQEVYVWRPSDWDAMVEILRR